MKKLKHLEVAIMTNAIGEVVGEQPINIVEVVNAMIDYLNELGENMQEQNKTINELLDFFEAEQIKRLEVEDEFEDLQEGAQSYLDAKERYMNKEIIKEKMEMPVSERVKALQQQGYSDADICRMLGLDKIEE